MSGVLWGRHPVPVPGPGAVSVGHWEPAAPMDLTVIRRQAVDLTAVDHYWLLTVADTAIELPPTPAVDRDAADGGLGLYLVARIAGDHGWTIQASRKVALVRIDYTRTEAPPEVVASVPRPRLQATRRNLSAPLD
jgi:hypothetical protein